MLNINVSSEKSISPESGEKYAQIKRKGLNKYVVGFSVRGQQGMDFFTGWSIIMDYGLVFLSEAKIWS